MATAREVRMRIRSVKNIAKVTGALQTVAASRVRRAQSQALATRAYANAALDILRSVATDARGEASHPLLTTRDNVKKISVILITSDRGLAGPFNSNVIKTAFEFEKKQSVPLQYVSIGRKGRDMLLRRGASIVAEFSDLPAVPSILDITAVTRIAMDDFLGGTVDEVYIAYTKFVNMLRQDPAVTRLLPLTPSMPTQESASSGEKRPSAEPSAVFSYEPSPEAILNEILPRFTELQLFQALLESLASEHSARMVAMQSATENANALVDDLTLVYNKARQLAITSEILDIVGGAEALAQTIEQS